MQLRANLSGERSVRRPGHPGERFVDHVLAVTELYVALVERMRASRRFTVERFDAEPACWWPDGRRGWIKPDALLVLRAATLQDFWWIEADMATESLPTIRRKLRTYLAFVERGRLGPGDVVPRVLFMAPTAERRDAIRAEADALPTPADYMFFASTFVEAYDFLIGELISW